LLMRVIDRVQDLVVRLVLDHGAGQHGLNTRGDQHQRSWNRRECWMR